MEPVSSFAALDNLSIATRTRDEPRSNDLGRDAFLQLMLAQLENQDPTSPTTNEDMVAQLAQFSQVENTEELNRSFTSLSNSLLSGQALQATSLVGRSVSAPSSTAILQPNGVISGSVELPASTGDMNVRIYSESGELLETVPLGSQTQGEVLFRWDGMNFEVNGELLDWNSASEDGRPAGEYRFEVTAAQQGETTELDTALSANVNSVTVGADGTLTLNLAGVGPVSIDQIKQFN